MPTTITAAAANNIKFLSEDLVLDFLAIDQYGKKQNGVSRGKNSKHSLVLA